MTSPAATTVPGLGAAEELLELLRKQQVLYGSLAKISQEQAAIVARGQTEELLGVLGRRQTLVDHLAQFNGRMEPYRKNWPAVWASLTPQQQQTAGAMVKDCQELLAKIIAQDDADRQHLQTAKNRLGAELQKMQQGGAAMNAYRAQAIKTAPRYTNRQG